MPLVTRTTKTGKWIKQSTEPSDVSNGNGWINTSNDPPTLHMSNGTEYQAIAIQLSSIPMTLDKAIGA